MICAALQRRGIDERGSGDFGASRGGRSHNGVDYLAEPGMLILAPVGGEVTKIGYCYKDDLSFRYVQITIDDYHHRIFYISPVVSIRQYIKKGDPIGHCQSLRSRYPADDRHKFPIPDHVHYEILAPSGSYVRQ